MVDKGQNNGTWDFGGRRECRENHRNAPLTCVQIRGINSTNNRIDFPSYKERKKWWSREIREETCLTLFIIVLPILSQFTLKNLSRAQQNLGWKRAPPYAHTYGLTTWYITCSCIMCSNHPSTHVMTCNHAVVVFIHTLQIHRIGPRRGRRMLCQTGQGWSCILYL